MITQLLNAHVVLQPLHGVICDPKTCNTSLHIQYCMSYNPVTRAQVVGFCLFESIPEMKIVLPPNISELNDFMCGHFNREGQLCGTCKKGYGPALFTNYECAECSTKNYGWALYLLLEFLPITVFYLIIVTFQVSATSGPLNVFILSAQLIAYILNYNNFIAYASQPWFQVTQKILITVYSVWNLDFLHSVIPPFCLSENITTLHALALQYLPAFYPLLLIIVTYILIELHDRNVRVLVWMWRPFQRCLAPFQRSLRWNPKASIVSTFATFLTLAYNKIIIVSSELLIGTRVTDIHGNSSRYLLLAPTVPYFGSEHLPFAILAIVVLSTFIALPPLLLIAYPTITFQKMLGCLKIRWQALHIFADVFQGCYKNRTDGKCDYRYFAAFYFILRIIIILLVSVFNKKWMGPIHSSPYHWISAVCSAASIQEELAKHSGQYNSSIAGSWNTLGALNFRDTTRKMDSIDRIYCSSTTGVLCFVYSMPTPFMVGNTSEMSAKVKNHLPVPTTKVARS